MSEINKSDKRYVKHEARMRDALVELIEQRDFQSITITEIIDTAVIGRATFYNHYNDKYELFDAIVTQMIKEIREVVSGENSSGVAYYEKVLALFTYLDAHVNTARVLFGPRGPEDFQREVCEVLWDGFHNNNEKFSDLVKQSGIPVDYLRVIIQMHFMLISAWLRREVRETPEEMTFILSKISVLSGDWVHEAIKGSQFGNILFFRSQI